MVSKTKIRTLSSLILFFLIGFPIFASLSTPTPLPEGYSYEPFTSCVGELKTVQSKIHKYIPSLFFYVDRSLPMIERNISSIEQNSELLAENLSAGTITKHGSHVWWNAIKGCNQYYEKEKARVNWLIAWGISMAFLVFAMILNTIANYFYPEPLGVVSYLKTKSSTLWKHLAPLKDKISYKVVRNSKVEDQPSSSASKKSQP